MRFHKLFGLALVVACATEEAPEIVHEKLESTEAAATAGWTIERSTVASRHPLPNDHKQSIEVRAPDTARKMRLRFDSIRMEQGYDFLIVQDGNGQEVERITGNHRGYVSRTIAGNKATILLETDSSVASWGFALAEVRHRGCSRDRTSASPLRAARNCTDLKDAIAALAEREVRGRFTQGHFGGPILFRSAAPERAAPPTAPAHSETNTQVAGVDEADLVKTDGNHIYVVAGRQLRVFRSWPAADLALLHSIDIEGYPRELFLDASARRIVVFSGVQSDLFVPGPIFPGIRMAPIWWRPDAYTKITVLDIAGGGAPRVVGESLIAGQYESARKMGDAVRMVLRRELRWPEIRYYPENVEWNTPAFDRAMDELEEQAIVTIRGRALADWLPKSHRVVNGQRVPLEIDCRDYQVQSSGDSLGLTSVITFNLATGSLQDTSLLVSPTQIYQSTENLYVTTDHQWSCWEDAGKEGQYTYVHKLDVSNPARTSYRASGGFAGGVLNQFSLDEHRGDLRVASTNQKWAAELEADRSVSRVYVLREDARTKRLGVIGTSADMAPGERIFSARFLGDRGFVVTFRQVDPLFTLDLSNPANPRILGELKVPGFSTYLHPLGDRHLFAVGNDFAEDGTTRNGVALSIFDVSNLAAPRLAHKALIGTSAGHSEALYDHRAFTTFTIPGEVDPVIAIPFTDFEPNDDPRRYWGTFKSTLKVFRVSPSGIVGLGEIDVADMFAQNGSNEWGWWYQPSVRRGVFVEGYAYAVTDAGIRTAAVRDLRRTVATVAAQPQWEVPPTPSTTDTEEVEGRPALAIPDANRTGVSTTLTLAKDLEIESLAVELDIAHTYRGDLVVSIEHDGTTEILHDRTGGSADDLKRRFETERFRGTKSRGVWTLTVIDTARADVGTINSWKLSVRGKVASGGTAPTRIERSYSNDQKFDIPDNSARGVSSTIEVPQGIKLESLSVEVKVRHSYRGDLRVLLEHDGVRVVLHDKSGGSLDDLAIDTALTDWAGRDARGTWTLTVSDHAAVDTGTLERFALRVAGTAL